MNHAILVLQPRAIPEALESFDKLPWPKARIIGLCEADLPAAVQTVCRAADSAGITHFTVVCDDCIVTEQAVRAVHKVAQRRNVIATGWCTLDAGPNRHLSNLTTNELPPQITTYDFIPAKTVREGPETVETTFVGLGAACFPVDVLHDEWPAPFGGRPGWGTDYKLSRNLTRRGFALLGVRDGEVTHLKEAWNHVDQRPDMRILVGEVQPRIEWET